MGYNPLWSRTIVVGGSNEYTHCPWEEMSIGVKCFESVTLLARKRQFAADLAEKQVDRSDCNR